MNPKHEALSPRAQKTADFLRAHRERNASRIEEGKREMIMTLAKARHERRHGNGKRTSKSEALERNLTMSKDYGKIRQ